MRPTEMHGVELLIARQNVRSGLTIVHTRLPFRYGNARLVACPHLVVQADFIAGGRRTQAVAADNLPPLWFDKDARKSYPQQVDDQIQAVRWALEPLGQSGKSGFALWRDVQAHVRTKVAEAGLPDLLAAFGISMVERLLWDGLGRSLGLGFYELVKENAFGLELGELDPSLQGTDVREILPPQPAGSIWARHTVGLADPIQDHEIAPGDAVSDGLPQSLDACIASYGYRFLKIKLSNNLAQDLERLAQIAEVVLKHEAARSGDSMIRCTLDGNEQYREVSELEELVAKMDEHPKVMRLSERVLFFEQPFARNRALLPEGMQGFKAFNARYPVIIDESDATPESYAEALALGYRGTSHKNCKGIVKSLLNLGRNHVHSREVGHPLIMSGEDLTNLGPVALIQDLAVAAALGIEHVERNGHHFFQGMRHVSTEDAQAAHLHHSGLFVKTNGITTLRITEGRMDVQGLRGPGLGDAIIPDLTSWPDWHQFDTTVLV